MHSKKAVLFDLDGTLVDTIRDIGTAMNSVLEQHGLPLHDLDAYRRMVGLGVRNLVAQAVAECCLDAESVDRLTAEMMEHYARFPLVHSQPYEGIPELLAALRARAIPTAVLSNKPDALTKVIVERLFPEHSFAFVQGERAGVPQKPDPIAALAICASLGIRPAEALFVGDSAVDVETAHNAGMACAGAAWGFRGEEELRNAGAGIIMWRADEVLELIIEG